MKSFLIICLTILFSLLTFKSYCNDPEKLLGVKLDLDKKEIVITVATNGCTQKNDFKLEMKKDTLTITRIKRDECKAMPSEISLSYSLQEAGINPNKPFVIKNSYLCNPFMVGIK